jgi:hypothetical protein
MIIRMPAFVIPAGAGAHDKPIDAGDLNLVSR